MGIVLATSDAAWRCVLLFALSVAPFLGPAEAVGARAPVVAATRLLLFLGVIAMLSLCAHRLKKRYPVSAFSLTAVAIGLPVIAFYFEGSRGPLLRGGVPGAVVVWLAIATLLGGPIASRLWRNENETTVSRSRRVAMSACGLVAGVLSIGFAAPRWTSRDVMWSQALAINPGDEAAAIAVANKLRSHGDPSAAISVLKACLRTNTRACDCASGVAENAVDIGRYADARSSLESTVTCSGSARRLALMAEALIGTRALDEGLREAELALSQDELEAHALYARAWARELKGDVANARNDAKRAVELGRGTPARLLYGVLLFNAGELDLAAEQFQNVASADPASVQAVYDLALIAQRRDQYREAREGYLRTLRMDPNLSDARYNLVVLTHDHGATLEAQHHVDEFAKAYPNDPRIATLRGILATAPARNALTIGK